MTEGSINAALGNQGLPMKEQSISFVFFARDIFPVFQFLIHSSEVIHSVQPTQGLIQFCVYMAIHLKITITAKSLKFD